jgi:hypothetical protein
MMNTQLRAASRLLAILGLIGGVAVDRAFAEPTGQSDELNYVHFDGDHTSMSGSSKDIARARRLRQGDEPLLWFRDGGREYVVRDPALLKQTEALWLPVSELGEAQGKLGTEQGKLGRQQGLLGARQGLIGTRQSALAAREATLDIRANNESLTPAQSAEIARQRRELKAQMHKLDGEMGELAKSMEALSDQMQVRGREMEVLSKKMEAASARATAELRVLTRQAIASGAARPVK